MAQAGSSGSPQSFTPRKRPKNREVENEMVDRVDGDGQPPHSATEPGQDAHKDDARQQDDKRKG